MKSPNSNQEPGPDGAAREMPSEAESAAHTLDAASFAASERATSVGTPEAYRPSLWDALIGFWSVNEPQPTPEPEPSGRWSLGDDDFSSEHGYQAGFEGRSEFAYGEFDRWL